MTASSYSSDNKFCSFFTNVNDTTYLNLLALDKNEPPRSFPNSYIDPNDDDDSYRYSSDNKFFLFQNSTQLQLRIWNLTKDWMEGQYSYVNKIKDFALSKNNRWLFLTTKNEVLKIIDLQVTPAQRRAHYDSKLRFTKEEKEQYGIE